MKVALQVKSLQRVVSDDKCYSLKFSYYFPKLVTTQIANLSTNAALNKKDKSVLRVLQLKNN